MLQKRDERYQRDSQTQKSKFTLNDREKLSGVILGKTINFYFKKKNNKHYKDTKNQEVWSALVVQILFHFLF